MKEDLETINKLAEELAIYFVEDISKFKLDEFLQIFKTFAERIKSSLEVIIVSLCLNSQT